MKNITRTIREIQTNVKLYNKNTKEIEECYHWIYGSEKDFNDEKEIKEELVKFWNNDEHILLDYEKCNIKTYKCSMSVNEFFNRSMLEEIG